MQILAINRTGSRSIANMDYIMSRLRSLPGANVRVFHGRENLHQAVPFFTNADVVIGFHGAGFVNCMWSKPGTLALEISSYSDWENTKVWRSNRQVVEAHSKLRWITYWLRLQSVIPNMTRGDYEAIQDKDHWIKDRARAAIPHADVLNMLEIIMNHVKRMRRA